MTKFIHLISSINPVEIDQIKIALSQEQIETRIVGENALLTGNIELTGTSGVGIKVREDKLIDANAVLEKLGYNINPDTKDNKYYNYAIIAMGLGFLAVILYMVYLSVS